MMAAASAAKNGANVVLLEKMPALGRKLLLTGQGRCNVTNNLEPKQFIYDCGSGARFLHGALNRFSGQDALDFFEQLGVKLVLERGGRYFPESQRSMEILLALQKALKQARVDVVCCARVLNISKQPGGFKISTPDKKYTADSLIIATGGKSYPATGSTGDGYGFAQELGHTIVPTRPSDVPLTVKEDFIKQLQGLSLKNVELKLWQGQKRISLFGEMLFTHYGISGPMALDASRVAGGWLKDGPVQCSLDLKPALSNEVLDQRLLRDMDSQGRKTYKNLLKGLLPSSLIPVFCLLSRINQNILVNQLNKEQRGVVRKLMKGIHFTITGLRGYDEAVVTAGGVDLSEVNPKTMESKKTPGLYFCGEVLDLDGPCGGYNLQIAWSTGFAAGNSV
ncbi:NAD(P)/FAD-dependent oxidoreductase [candidate division TA06 bacterium]|nr:NAD(P)/FAD-dependent oxidoreductase [candidate division TA06 bacterium]